MNHKDFILQMLPTVIAMDVRLQICLLKKDKSGVFIHEWTECPKCKARWILENFN